VCSRCTTPTPFRLTQGASAQEPAPPHAPTDGPTPRRENPPLLRAPSSHPRPRWKVILRLFPSQISGVRWLKVTCRRNGLRIFSHFCHFGQPAAGIFRGGGPRRRFASPSAGRKVRRRFQDSLQGAPVSNRGVQGGGRVVIGGTLFFLGRGHFMGKKRPGHRPPGVFSRGGGGRAAGQAGFSRVDMRTQDGMFHAGQESFLPRGGGRSTRREGAPGEINSGRKSPGPFEGGEIGRGGYSATGQFVTGRASGGRKIHGARAFFSL